jgi:hypothetical protein
MSKITEDGRDTLQPGSEHQDPANRYPSGERNAYAGGTITRNDRTDWDRVTSNPTQFGSGQEVRDFMLSKMDERPRNGAERPDLNSGIGYDNFDRSKRQNAADGEERLRQSREGLKTGKQSANVQQDGIYYNRPGISS